RSMVETQHAASLPLVLALLLLRQINSQLLTLLIKMTAFHSQRFGGVGDVMLLAIEFSEDDSSFDLIHALGERSVTIRRRTSRHSLHCGQRHSYNCLVNNIVRRQQKQTLDHVAQFPDISRP